MGMAKAEVFAKPVPMPADAAIRPCAYGQLPLQPALPDKPLRSTPQKSDLPDTTARFCPVISRCMHAFPTPHIAIVSPNTLVCAGLRAILEEILPMARIAVFPSLTEIPESDREEFFHYFVTPGILLQSQDFFAARRHRVIVLVTLSSADYPVYAPGLEGYHTLDIGRPEDELTAAIIQMARNSSHRKAAKTLPESLNRPTARELDVLRLIVQGLTNKEIAARLGISVTTAISHRKNLQEKLRIRNVAGLTLYAVMHGLCSIEA